MLGLYSFNLNIGSKNTLQIICGAPNVAEGQIIAYAMDKVGRIIDFDSDYCLVSVGRTAYSVGLGIEYIYFET